MRSVMGLISVVVLAVMIAGCRPPSGAPGGAAPAEGQKPAGFTMPDLANPSGSISLSSFDGKVVLLDFWATWCPPCRSELPALNQMYQDLKDKGFAIIGITLDQGDQTRIAKAVQGFNLSYPVGLGDANIVNAYGGVRAIPTKFLLDKKGMVRKSYVGAQPREAVQKDVEALLAE